MVKMKRATSWVSVSAVHLLHALLPAKVTERLRSKRDGAQELK